MIMGSPQKTFEEQEQLTLPSPLDNGGSTDPPKRRYRRRMSFYNDYDQEKSCTDLAKMIIMHDYPLHMVEHAAFISFVHSIQPQFKMPDSSAIERVIMEVHQKEKQSISSLISDIPGKISLTIGLWTTSQTLGYVALKGHFIDNGWKLRNLMLNVIMVSSPHSENALSDAIGFSLSDWNMKSKLFTITLDNDCSSHDIYSANLRDHLFNKNMLMLKGQLFVVRCYANVLNIVAQDVIASIHGIVYNVRESVKYVKAYQMREDKFLEMAKQLQIASTKRLSFDVQTQWNSTYQMLSAALDFRSAFTCLETYDPNYNEAPSADDWRKVEIVCAYLKLLYDSANSILNTAEHTSNIYFHEVWKILLELKNATSNEDGLASSIANDMHEKFDKYWKDCSLVLAITVVMDPRFKMKLIEFSYNKIYGEDAQRYIKVVNDAVHSLYLEYGSQMLPQTPASTRQEGQEQKSEANVIDASNITNATDANNVEPMNGEPPTNMTTEANNQENNDTHAGNKTGSVNGAGTAQGITTLSSGDDLLDFDIFISETAVTKQTKPELEQYLEEALVPRIQEFDILYWWKLNTLKYPTLSKMARDVLSIPMSMDFSGAMFSSSSGSRVLDDYQSSLQPETMEALFCTKDWLQYSVTRSETPAPATVKMES